MTMQNPCTRTMILAIGGALEPGEGVKGYLRRVAQAAQLGFRSVERAYYRQYASAETRLKLEKAATIHAAHNIARRIEKLADQLAQNHPAVDQHQIDALRRVAVRLRRTNGGVKP